MHAHLRQLAHLQMGGNTSRTVAYVKLQNPSLH